MVVIKRTKIFILTHLEFGALRGPVFFFLCVMVSSLSLNPMLCFKLVC